MTMALTQIEGGDGLKKPVDFADTEKARFGTDGDLNIQHSGSNSFVETTNSSTGDLYVISNGASHDLYLQANDDVFIRPADGQNGIRVLGNSAVELYHNNSKKLETKSDGIGVTGEVECTFLDLNGNADISGNLTVGGLTTVQGDIDLQDGDQILIGTDDDLRLYHADSNSSINNYNGGLFISNYSDDQDITLRTDNGSGGLNNYIICDGSSGAVRLFNYGSEKLTTFSSGVDISGELQCDSLDVDGAVDITGTVMLHNDLDMQDSNAIKLGAGDDLRLYHNGSNSFIENYTGGLYIDQQLDNSDIILRTDNGNGSVTDYIRCDGGAGKVRLYNYGSQKLETTSSGIDVNGKAVCDSFLNTGITELDGSYVSFNDNGYIRGDVSGIFQLQAGGSNTFRFVSADNSVTYAEITTGGLNPGANNNYDLGNSSLRWRNVYTNDLNLSNEGGANDVDGTWGNYTIQEGEDDLFLINRRSGKKYKFNLTEVN